jgi:hypothetical protein
MKARQMSSSESTTLASIRGAGLPIAASISSSVERTSSKGGYPSIDSIAWPFFVVLRLAMSLPIGSKIVETKSTPAALAPVATLHHFSPKSYPLMVLTAHAGSVPHNAFITLNRTA